MARTIDALRVAQDIHYAASLTAEEWAGVAQSPDWIQMVAKQHELVAATL
jgi:hypothetical protein